MVSSNTSRCAWLPPMRASWSRRGAPKSGSMSLTASPYAPCAKAWMPCTSGSVTSSGQGVSLGHEAPQSVDHLIHVYLIAGDREGQGGMGVPEGRARPRSSRDSQVAHFLRRDWRRGATVQRPKPQQGSAIV